MYPFQLIMLSTRNLAATPTTWTDVDEQGRQLRWNSRCKSWCWNRLRNKGEYEEDDNAERDGRCVISNWSSLSLMGRWEESLKRMLFGVELYVNSRHTSVDAYDTWSLRQRLTKVRQIGVENREIENNDDADAAFSWELITASLISSVYTN